MLSLIPKMDIAHSPAGGRGPSVSEALRDLTDAIQYAKNAGIPVIKIVHGYGSSGTGGDIKLAVHKELGIQKAGGHILLYVPGENWSVMDPAIGPLRDEYDVIDDKELGSSNPGMTVVWVKKTKKKRLPQERAPVPPLTPLIPDWVARRFTHDQAPEEAIPPGHVVAPSEPPTPDDLPVPLIVEAHKRPHTPVGSREVEDNAPLSLGGEDFPDTREPDDVHTIRADKEVGRKDTKAKSSMSDELEELLHWFRLCVSLGGDHAVYTERHRREAFQRRACEVYRKIKEYHSGHESEFTDEIKDDIMTLRMRLSEVCWDPLPWETSPVKETPLSNQPSAEQLPSSSSQEPPTTFDREWCEGLPEPVRKHYSCPSPTVPSCEKPEDESRDGEAHPVAGTPPVEEGGRDESSDPPWWEGKAIREACESPPAPTAPSPQPRPVRKPKAPSGRGKTRPSPALSSPSEPWLSKEDKWFVLVAAFIVIPLLVMLLVVILKNAF